MSKVNHYYRLSEIDEYMRAGLDEAQAGRLSERERDEIAGARREAMRRFDYEGTGDVLSDSPRHCR